MPIYTSKYYQVVVGVPDQTTGMSDQERLWMAGNITETETLPFANGMVTYTPAYAGLVVPDHTGASSDLSMISWGSSTTKAVLTVYENSVVGINDTGCGAPALPILANFTLLYVIQIDRINDLGNLTNSDPISMSIYINETGDHSVSAYQCNVTHLNMTDIVDGGGSVEQMNGTHFAITAPHTSSFAIFRQTTLTANTTDDGSDKGLYGLFALLLCCCCCCVPLLLWIITRGREREQALLAWNLGAYPPMGINAEPTPTPMAIAPEPKPSVPLGTPVVVPMFVQPLPDNKKPSVLDNVLGRDAPRNVMPPVSVTPQAIPPYQPLWYTVGPSLLDRIRGRFGFRTPMPPPISMYQAPHKLP